MDFNQKLTTDARNGNLEGVKEAIEQGADINYKFGLALCYASKHGHIEIVKYLLDQKSFIRKELVSVVKNQEVLKLLIEKLPW
ncbi:MULTISPECIES: ankyrin repeat domain-containing protein [Burkholderia cepacia complex]|uniref:ankyrin repeat domain-containing protein n=1 Tax=Burkholderia cenocepacia TaxID=95486 RepID=UPI0022379588|nr:ankyrin repeat domain-containing protein [Burkholderia cenocepacia]MCW5156391.1 ankyrin repeat domain-containing protein [Burkholderia cenocepacia]